MLLWLFSAETAEWAVTLSSNNIQGVVSCNAAAARRIQSCIFQFMYMITGSNSECFHIYKEQRLFLERVETAAAKCFLKRGWMWSSDSSQTLPHPWKCVICINISLCQQFLAPVLHLSSLTLFDSTCHHISSIRRPNGVERTQDAPSAVTQLVSWGFVPPVPTQLTSPALEIQYYHIIYEGWPLGMELKQEYQLSSLLCSSSHGPPARQSTCIFASLAESYLEVEVY